MIDYSKSLSAIIKKCFRNVLYHYQDLILSSKTDDKQMQLNIDKCPNPEFGDYCTNFFITNSFPNVLKQVYLNRIIKDLNKKNIFQKVILVNGYINFFLKDKFLKKYVLYTNSLSFKHYFKPQRLFYNIEYCSANPTGLMHIGHARNAAYGQTLVNIWRFYGIKVNSEYYINDGGNQIDNLLNSVLVSYLNTTKKTNYVVGPDGYNGLEIKSCSEALKKTNQNRSLLSKHEYEVNHDSTIKLKLNKTKNLLYKHIVVEYMLDQIKATLSNFNVKFDIWFYESWLYENNNYFSFILQQLKSYIYSQDGAKFLKTTVFGDDKDRTLIKSDKTYTYFFPDIIYNYIKMGRGYDRLFTILGADHGGYTQRIIAAMKMLNNDSKKLHFFIQQMVKLKKDGQEIKMSKRSGKSLTLNDLLEMIGSDNARWYMVSTSFESAHLEIDIDKIKLKTIENPLYYVQYAYARIHQLLSKNYTLVKHCHKLNLLKLGEERKLLATIANFKNVIEIIAKNFDVHRLLNYLFNLAKEFHAYYSNKNVILADDSNKNKIKLSYERLFLCKIVQNIIKHGLTILNITPMEIMEKDPEVI